MNYDEFALKIIDLIGGKDNIVKIQKKNNFIILKLWDITHVDQNSIKNLKLIKDISLQDLQLKLKLRFRDSQYSFEAFKRIPGSQVIKIPPPPEEINDKSFLERLSSSIFGDILPLLLAMIAGGFLVGIITFIGRIFGQ